jgi:predicted Rossmann fold nucleotide-binding protein DprA/Smf involved in DNA uptake
VIDVNKYLVSEVEQAAAKAEYEAAKANLDAIEIRRERVTKIVRECSGVISEEAIIAALDTEFGSTSEPEPPTVDAPKPARKAPVARRARASADEMEERKQAVLAQIHAGVQSIKQMAENTGIPYQNVQNVLKKLKDGGCIESDPWRVL